MTYDWDVNERGLTESHYVHQYSAEMGTLPARNEARRFALKTAIEQAETISDLKRVMLRMVSEQ